MAKTSVPASGEETRRVFVVRACLAAAGATLGTSATGCGGGGGGSSPTAPSPVTGAATLPTVTANVSGSQALLTIDGGSPLASVGGAALVQAGGTQVLVARTAQDAFAAVTAICTHEACTINGVTGATFVCPCHGSRFSTSGAVLNGPATRALRQFATQFSGGVLAITL